MQYNTVHIKLCQYASTLITLNLYK